MIGGTSSEEEGIPRGHKALSPSLLGAGQFQVRHCDLRAQQPQHLRMGFIQQILSERTGFSFYNSAMLECDLIKFA